MALGLLSSLELPCSVFPRTVITFSQDFMLKAHNQSIID